MIGAGVIGLGAGLAHCQGYFENKHVNLIAVSDLLNKRLSKAKSFFPKVDVYKDYRELLKRDDINLVSIVVPPFLHAEITLDAIEAGKHVFMEKPMAFTLEECDKIIDATEKNNVKITVDFELRFSPIWSDIKKSIDEGKMGQIASVKIDEWRKPFHGPIKPGKWGAHRKFAGSMFFEEALHWFDMLRWYGGEISSIHCLTNDWVRKEFDYDQTAFINLNYESGAIGNISQTINGFEYHMSIWAIGTKGSILASTEYSPWGNYGISRFASHPENLVDEYKVYKQDNDHVEYIVDTKHYGEEISEEMSIKRHIHRFVEDIIKDKTPLVTVDDGRKSVEFCLAAEMSSRNNKPVNLPLKKSPDFALQRAKESLKAKEEYLKLIPEWPYIKGLPKRPL